MFWHDWFFQPLYTFLIYLYYTIGRENLGLAVIELTVVVRLVLLPLSLISERNALAFDRIQAKIRAIEAESATEPVLKKERIRDLLKRHRVNPWAKVLALAIQLAILVVLYQVFIGGINNLPLGPEITAYAYGAPPINTIFLGQDLGRRSILWAAIVGVYLLMDIGISLARRAHLDRSDLYYFLFFPVFCFLILWYLPMVKSLFILTSLLFSSVLATIRILVFRVKTAAEDDE